MKGSHKALLETRGCGHLAEVDTARFSLGDKQRQVLSNR